MIYQVLLEDSKNTYQIKNIVLESSAVAEFLSKM